MKNENLFERVVTIENKIDAFHGRQDRLESLIHDDIGEIKVDFKELKTDVKELTAWMHRSKGWAAAAVFLAGLAGALIGGMLH